MKRLVFIMSFFIVLFFFWGACAKDNENPVWDSSLVEDTKEKTDYHVLVIGNSLSNDAFGYTPFLLQELCPAKKIYLTILYRSSTTLKTHWEYLESHVNKHTKEYCDQTASCWTYQDEVFPSDVISSSHWDLVILQQSSVKAFSFDETQPYVHLFANYFKSLSKDTRVAYIIGQSRVKYSQSSGLSDKTMEEIWTMQSDVARRLLEEGEVDYIIPCGTAIQNARETRLDVLGAGGHLTYDGTHLQEGLPCMIDAYTSTQSILNIFSIDASIEHSQLRVTDLWGGSTQIPGRNGRYITGNDEDYALCAQCALMAIKQPLEITKFEHNQ